jgi:tRNA-binding EMAP/Myf-like protein
MPKSKGKKRENVFDFDNPDAELASLSISDPEPASAKKNTVKGCQQHVLSAAACAVSNLDGQEKAVPEQKAAQDKDAGKGQQVAPSVPEHLKTEIPTADLKKAIQKIGFTFKKVIVAKVVSVSPHPKARRGEELSVVTVNDGRNDVVVVCSDLTVQPGQLIPFAPVGSELGDPLTQMPIDITAQKLRGIDSFGLLCRFDPPYRPLIMPLKPCTARPT